MAQIPISRIAVSGARGWLGRELMEGLLSDWGWEALKENTFCLGSSSGQITLSNGMNLPVTPFESGIHIEDLDGFVHLAYLTKDKARGMTSDSYIANNLRLTSHALSLIGKLQPRWVCTVSSGAAVHAGNESEAQAPQLQENPYGFMKATEEALLRAECGLRGINLSIGRLWGAAGSRMPPNSLYAISDFIQCGLRGQTIQVQAKHEVWRRYCDAGTFMKLLVLAAHDNKQIVFDSGGPLIEIRKLAEIVSLLTSRPFTFSEVTSDETIDDYFPRGNNFEDLCANYGLPVASIESLVQETLNGHLKQISA